MPDANDPLLKDATNKDENTLNPSAPGDSPTPSSQIENPTVPTAPQSTTQQTPQKTDIDALPITYLDENIAKSNVASESPKQPDPISPQAEHIDDIMSKILTNPNTPESGATEQTFSPPEPPSPKQEPSQKKHHTGVIVAAIVLLFITLPVTIYMLAQQRQVADLRSRADCGAYPCTTDTPPPPQDTSTPPPVAPTNPPSDGGGNTCPNGFTCYQTHVGPVSCTADQNGQTVQAKLILHRFNSEEECRTVDPKTLVGDPGLPGNNAGSCTANGGNTNNYPSCQVSSVSIPNCSAAQLDCLSSAQGVGPGGAVAVNCNGCGSSPTPTPRISRTPTPTPRNTNTPTPTPSNQCVRIRVYKDGEVVEPSTLMPGDEVSLAVSGTALSTKGRIRVNGAAWNETTQKNTSGEYFVEFTIPTSVVTFTVEAEVFSNTIWQ